ncbi:MAG: ABC transporter ATP-binding protein [Anaerolineaceae bacterium]|nr:ABC transporter ATP-binding protein [Anaerolineaceae bacterium]
MLSVRQIVKYYDGDILLDHISLEVAQHETVCLLGASGSGKSTLLKIIAGLEEAEGGQIFWQDQNLADTPVHKRNFGLMFQEYALFPHRSIAQNVAFGLEMQKLPKEIIQKKVADALDLVELTQFAQRSVTDLSGGEKQRVALARALAPQPRLLMLDEPLGALDRGLRDQLIFDLRRILRKSGIPAIYVTHDQEEAYTIADRMMLLNEGKVVQSGKPQQLYENPQSEWVAEFLGLTNRFSGKVTSVSPLVVNSALGQIALGACSKNKFQPGEQVSLILKPAGLILKPEHWTGQKAQILDCVFSGEMYRISLKIEDMNIKVLSRKPFEAGSKTGYEIQPDAIICLPEAKE